MFNELKANEDKIANDLIAVQGNPADLGGYYLPDDKKVSEIMRPSETLNKIIDEM
jgi:isocitrate dehydrogenase